MLVEPGLDERSDPLMGKMNLGRCKGLIRGTRVDAAVILLAGLLPLFWFRGSLIAGMDLPWPLSSPSYLVRSAASTWNPALCLGTADVSFRSALYFVISLGLHKLGFSLLATEKFWFVFWFAGAGLSMYFLIRALVPGNRLAALGGALFYMFNPYVMVVRLYELNLWLFFYALAPAVLALFATSIRTGRKLHVAGFLLASLLVTMSYANLGSVIMLAMLLGGYLVVYLVQNRRSRERMKRALGCASVLAVLWLGINAWWILPSISSLRQEASFRQKNESTMELLEMTSRESAWHRVLRLQGYWAFDQEEADEPLFPYARRYERSHVDALGWLIPALGFAGLWRVRRERELLWPGILWLASAFFMKGTRPPLGSLTRWIFASLPGMSVFRHPFDKFGMLALVGLAPLVGVGMEGFFGWVRRRVTGKRAGMTLGACAYAVTALLLLVLLVWPMWTGEAIYAGGSKLASFRIREVPDPYREAASWLKEQGDVFRILPLPYNRGFWSLAMFDWYQGHDPTRLVLESDVAVPSVGYAGGELAEQAAYDLLLGRECARLLCNLLGVKYILLRADANWEILSGDIRADTRRVDEECLFMPLPEMRRSLDGLDWLQPVGSFGPLTFYLNRDWKPTLLYAQSDYAVVDTGGENLLEAGNGEESGNWEPLGDVEWEVEEPGSLTLESHAGAHQEVVGARKNMRSIKAPLTYRFRLRASANTRANLFIKWYDAAGAPLSNYLLMEIGGGTADWTERSGFLLKPPEAAGAELVILMEPSEGARVEVKDLFVGEQSWIKALCSGEGYSPDTVYISREDAERLPLSPETSGETSPPTCTIESSRPWSAKLRLKTDGPCFLVLNQAYDAGWQAYLGSPGWLKVLTSSGDLPAAHLMVNGYANAWFVEEAGEYEVTLYYRPQTLLYLGVALSALTWVLFAAWCIFITAASRGRQKGSSEGRVMGSSTAGEE